MKIRNWLCLTYMFVMLVPFLATAFFVVYLQNWYEEKEISEYLHVAIRINELSSLVKSDYRLYVQPWTAERTLTNKVEDDEQILLYSKARLPIYRSDHQQLSNYSISASRMMKNLYETKETLTHFIYKEPVYHNGELIGFFEIKKERTELKQQIQRTMMYAVAFLVMMMILTILLVQLLVKLRILRPISTLLSEMKKVGDGDYLEHEQTYRGLDEISQLLQGFYEMNDALRAANEKEAQMQVMRQRLIASISHDLRTPLTSIKAYAEGMKDHVDKQEDYRDIIVRKAHYMEKLINDLLLFSRLESNDFQLYCTSVDGEELAELLLDGYEQVHEQRSIRFQSCIDVDECEVHCDVDRLLQVMDNLVSNAIRFSNEGDLVELIATTNSKRLNEGIPRVENHLYFLVEDSGIGIREEEKEHIFSLFYQVDVARQKHRGTGAGLGLAISKNLVEKHGGFIGVKSEYGKGSIFYFAIPIKNNKSF